MVVVFITGCSEGGIGEAMALEFARQGCRVVATARSLASLKRFQDVEGVQCMALDVLDHAAIDAAVGAAIARFGQIDVLVNNAGVACLGPVAEVPIDRIERAFRTNVFGVVALVQKVVPHMVANGGGKIVNIGSIAAYASGPWMSGYTASKSALHALTDSMRLELKPFNIHVTLVTPGAITSRFADNALASGELELRLYEPFEESIRYRARISQGPSSTPAAAFARNAVAAVLRRKPPATYAYGRLTWILYTLYYVPLCIRDWFFSRLFKMNKIKVA